MALIIRSYLCGAMLGVACLAVSSGCSQPAASKLPAAVPTPVNPWFADATAELGLDFQHDPGPVDGKYFMPQINGSGAATFRL